jgi:hypothetical protein
MKTNSKNTNTIVLIIYLSIFVLAIVGECRCIYKAITCNWEPIGKAEIIYTGASLTGAGAIVGFFNIEDK